MTHSASGPTVSLEEAQRLEKKTAQQLLKALKLSLIVDLYQTIVHATVNPTVGDWISEGENWEERQRRRIEKKATKTNTPEDDDSGSGDPHGVTRTRDKVGGQRNRVRALKTEQSNGDI